MILEPLRRLYFRSTIFFKVLISFCVRLACCYGVTLCCYGDSVRNVAMVTVSGVVVCHTTATQLCPGGVTAPHSHTGHPT